MLVKKTSKIGEKKEWSEKLMRKWGRRWNENETKLWQSEEILCKIGWKNGENWSKTGRKWWQSVANV